MQAVLPDVNLVVEPDAVDITCQSDMDGFAIADVSVVPASIP